MNDNDHEYNHDADAADDDDDASTPQCFLIGLMHARLGSNLLRRLGRDIAPLGTEEEDDEEKDDEEEEMEEETGGTGRE